jgi:hypothetical protein
VNYALNLTQQELDYIAQTMGQRPWLEVNPVMVKLQQSAAVRDAAVAEDTKLLAAAKDAAAKDAAAKDAAAKDAAAKDAAAKDAAPVAEALPS